jgi:uncharacterized alkaline shock family protein YloU
MQSEGKLGQVVMAPEVLLTIVRETVLSTEGVVCLHRQWPENITKLLGIHRAAEGISIHAEGGALTVDIHIVAHIDAQMLSLGRTLQSAVARSIEDIAGLNIEAINIHIEDVAADVVVEGEEKEEHEDEAA